MWNLKEIKRYLLGPEKKSSGYGGSCSVSTGGQAASNIQNNSFLSFALGYAGGYYTLTDTRAMSLYGQSSALATAVDIILQELAGIKPILKYQDGTIDDGHEILSFLQDPNEFNESWSTVVTDLGQHYLLTGNSHVYLAGNVRMKPLEMYAVKPQNVSVVEGADTYPYYYTIDDGPGSTESGGGFTYYSQYTRESTKNGFRFYTKDMDRELWHIKRQSAATDKVRGDSPLKAICLDIEQQIKGRLHNSKLLENGARPSALAVFKDEGLTQDQFLQRRQLLNEQLAGASNAGKIAVVASDTMELHEMGQSNRDMDYAELESISEKAIYNRYRIPLALVTNDASTFNNLSQAVLSLYDFAVIPTAKALFSSLSMLLLPRFGLDPSKVQISYDPDSIDVIRNRRLDELVKRKELGAESINEIREGMSNREPVEGGDEILVPANQFPLSSVGGTDAETALTPEQEAEKLAERDGA